MANKVRFYETWDLKSIFKSVLFLSILVLFAIGYYMYPTIYNYYKQSKYDQSTIGRITKIDQKVIIRQTTLGSNPSTDHYDVEFTYQVEGQEYFGSDEIYGTANNRSKLLKILNSIDSTASIKYLSEDPTKSILDLTME